MKKCNSTVQWRVLILFIAIMTQGQHFALADESTEAVTLQLHWKHQFEYAGYYAAQHKGYFAEEGLEVRIDELPATRSPVDLVLDGSANFGILPSGLILEYLRGEPLQILANDLKISPLILLASTEYTNPAQLKNQKVMAAHNEPLYAEILYMLKANGINHDDIKWIDHSFDVNDIITGRVAAMTAYQTNQPYELIKNDIPYTTFAPSDHGIDFYGNFLFTSQIESQKHPDRTQSFVRASKKGWEYALAHPEEIIDYIIAHYPVQKSRDALLFEANEIKRLMLSDTCPVGSIDPLKIEKIASMFVALNMADAGYDLTELISAETKICEEAKIPPVATGLPLTVSEKLFLSSQPPLKACMVKDWPPFEMMDDQGQFTGISPDFSHLITEQIGMEITPVPSENLTEMLQNAKNRICDVILLLEPTPETEKFLSFTTPLFKTAIVIIGKTGQGYLGGLNDLAGKTLVMIRNHNDIESIRQNHPDINLLLVDTIPEAFRKVAHGEADATLSGLINFVSYVSRMGLPNLEIIGETDLSFQFAIAVRNDDPTLVSIIQKAVAALPPEDVTDTVNRWFQVRVEEKFDYSLFWKIVGTIFVLTSFLVYRHIVLSRYHNKLQIAHKEILKEKESAEKALHAEEEAVKSNIRFIDMISHEYKTPVSVIRTNIDIMQLKTTRGDIEFDENLTKMKQATAKLVKIIETALDPVRLQSDKLIPHNSDFELDDVFAKTVTETLASHTGRKILFNDRTTDKTSFYGDPALIILMLRNLLENALKYSAADTTVTLTLDLKDRNYFITVQDQGKGIPEHDRESVFEKFHRGSNSTGIPGVGIGLYMVKTIVKQHGGTISVSSSPKGTAVSISLPAEKLPSQNNT